MPSPRGDSCPAQGRCVFPPAGSWPRVPDTNIGRLADVSAAAATARWRAGNTPVLSDGIISPGHDHRSLTPPHATSVRPEEVDMHPVLMQDLAAEHIKAMTAAAGMTRSVRRARRARRRKDAGRTGRRATDVARRPARSRAMSWRRHTDSPATSPRLLAACRVRGALRSCVIVSWLEGNAHAAGNR